MRYSEVKKLLRKHGCYLHRQGKRHEQWYSPITGNTFSVSRHDSEEAKSGTLESILKAAGIKL